MTARYIVKKFKFIVLYLCITILMTSCGYIVAQVVDRTVFVILHVLNPSVHPLVPNKKYDMEAKFYRALYWYMNHFDEIEDLLKAGVDPNRCEGVAGWYDSNPLCVMVSAVPPPQRVICTDERQMQILRLLHEYGADIHRRPYIWYKVNEFNNEYLDDRLKSDYSFLAGDIMNIENESELEARDDVPYFRRIEKLAAQLEMEDSERDKKFMQYIDYSNKVIKVLLEMGADPDQKGHPFPFTREAILMMNDKKAAKYFAQGTRAINEAIEKGMRWESQVDLLLQYTSLDEESLNAARRSTDPKMIEKINALWKDSNSMK